MDLPQGDGFVDNFLIAFNAVMPLMVYLILGQVIYRVGWMSKKSMEELNFLIFKLLLPINLMMNLYNAEVAAGFRVDVLIFAVLYVFAIFILYAIIIPLIEKDPRKRGVMLQGSMRSNFVLFGLPIAESLLDGRDITMTTVLIAILVPLNNVLSVVALSIYTDDHKIDFKQLLLTILKNPMFIATVIGLILVGLDIKLPTFLVNSLNGISKSITPLALIAMGGTFNFSAVKNTFKQASITTFLRLVVSPIIGLTAAILLGFRDENLIPLMIFFGGPTAVSSYTMAVSMDGDGDLAGQVVVFTTLGSLITMMIWIMIVRGFGFI